MASKDSKPFRGFYIKSIYGNQITDIDNEIDESLLKSPYLHQNYPNPFNPKTNIPFSLPISGKVILKVFNLLGNEVGTLLEEEKHAGNFEVEFDASNLPSGIYLHIES